MHWWKVRRNSDTKILSEKIIYLGDKSNSDNLEYIYICIYKIDYDLDVKLQSIFDVEKKHRRNRKRKREATKFGRELRLTATRSARRIIADRSHSTLISAREGKRLLPLCASGTRERRFRGNATTDFRGLNARRGFSQCPNSTFTLNRPLLVINNFCAQEREQKRELQSTNIHCVATNVSTLRSNAIPLSRRALSILLFSEKHPHDPTTDSNKTCGRRLETNFPFLDIPPLNAHRIRETIYITSTRARDRRRETSGRRERVDRTKVKRKWEKRRREKDERQRSTPAARQEAGARFCRRHHLSRRRTPCITATVVYPRSRHPVVTDPMFLSTLLLVANTRCPSVLPSLLSYLLQNAAPLTARARIQLPSLRDHRSPPPHTPPSRVSSFQIQPHTRSLPFAFFLLTIIDRPPAYRDC